MESSRFDSVLDSAAMRLPLVQVPVLSRSPSRGPLWIGIGLGLLVANVWWPAIPAVTAMALVALGATVATVERFGRTAHAHLFVILNLTAYCGLFALFVGATLHPANVGAGHRLDALTAFDLTASAWPMTAMLVASWRALRRFEAAE
jgi:hypothetical protein